MNAPIPCKTTGNCRRLLTSDALLAPHRTIWLALCLGLFASMTAPAQQTVSMRANPTRFTIPVNVTNTVTSTVTVTIGGSNQPVNLSVTGLPTGAGASLDIATFTNSGTAILTLNTTNVAPGEYDVALEASGAATNRLPLPVLAAFVWSGAAGTTNISSAGNWLGGVAPGNTDNLAFSDAGVNAANTVPTVRVTSNTEVGSLRLIHGGTQWQNFDIAAGVTLSVTGDRGLMHLRDQLPAGSRSYFSVSGSGTLLVSNANATFAMLIDAENTANNFDLDALDTLNVDVSKVAFDDFRAYPNITTNGNTTEPRRWSPHVWLAKTNVIRATHTDANNWSDPAVREYGLVIGRCRAAQGTGTDFRLYFGLSNSIFMDSMLICGSGTQADAAANGARVQFNNTLTGTKTAVFRGTNGGRMSNLTFSDASGPGTITQGTKVIADFTLGAVDALVDKLYLSRNATNTSGGNAETTLLVSAGTLNANTAILGFQEGTNLTAAGVGYCRGTLTLSGSGTLVVNSNLVLGYTEEAAATAFGADQGYGQLNITGPAAAYVNTITVGGPSLATLNNTSQRITLSSAGTLVVSNTLGSSSARLNTLSMTDSTLGLNVDLTASTPYVYVTTLTTAGSSNVLDLTISTTSPSYPVTIPLISYTGSAAPNFVLKLPSGFYGYVVNNSGASTIDAVISTTPPQDLVWNGNVNGNWDTTSANWQGSLVFANGDKVTFNDTASGTTSVTVPTEVTPGPGGVLVNNTTNSYSFVSGVISGTGLMTKQGTNTLTVDATSSLPLAINDGTVNGSGTVGATTVASNAVFNFSGTVNQLTTAGTSASSGTINIGLSVTGGIMDNAGTVNGAFGTSGSSITTNRSGATITHSGVATVAAGSTLINNGVINNGIANTDSRLAINGYLIGSGSVEDTTGDTAGNNGRLEITSGGVFMPGGSNVIGSFKVGGRFDLSTATPVGGTLVIDVDMNNSQTNDVLYVDKWSNFRGALTMNNIGSVPFAAGQSFLIYSNNFGFPNTPEAAFDLTNKITPVVPGVGLKWDVSNLKSNGLIAVIQGPLTTPFLTNVFSGGTNLTMSWSSTHLGYQLKVQTNTLGVGISTNWFPVVGSEYTNAWTVPVDPIQPTVFYRLSNQP